MKTDNREHSYNDFLNTESVAPPEKLSILILNMIKEDLHFSPMAVVAKLGFIHIFTTLIILYICPQFGVRIGGASFSLMDAFMKFGHLACAALCGATLVGGTFFMAAMLLKPQESFWLKKQMPWVLVSLSALTLITLVIMGASAHHTEFVLWCSFGIIGGWATFELGRKSRLYGTRILLKLTA